MDERIFELIREKSQTLFSFIIHLKSYRLEKDLKII